MDKYKILQQYFGHSQFRNGQEDIIDNILSGKDIMAIMPTGAGKSICYQIPALILEGITIVVSPLISLMCDQVSALVQSGIAGAYINSSLTPKQLNLVFTRANQGRYKIIYIAPERLTSPEFIYFAEHNKISMVTVDEAHCVSHWGQNFRPSYLKISDFISMLSYRPIISAFTATATKEVKNDITRILQLDNPFTIATGFNRQNLYFEVKKPDNKPKELLSLISDRKNKSGIIYCNTRKNVEDICYYLQQRGYNATRYHAGLDNTEREQNQKSFIYDQNNIMVATNAFGMGIDKSNVSFVIHYNMPKSIEDYYQEAGRAGRDGEPADCILLYTPQDVRTNQFLIENSSDVNEDLPENIRKRILNKNLERLREMTFYCTTHYCLRHYILKYFGEFSPKNCDNCSICNNQPTTPILKSAAHQEIDITLLVKLKSLRSDIAQRTHTPAYIIFSDATLRDMCVKLPKNQTQFLSVIGVSKRKADNYSDEFISLINNYLLNSK